MNCRRKLSSQVARLATAAWLGTVDWLGTAVRVILRQIRKSLNNRRTGRREPSRCDAVAVFWFPPGTLGHPLYRTTMSRRNGMHDIRTLCLDYSSAVTRKRPVRAKIREPDASAWRLILHTVFFGCSRNVQWNHNFRRYRLSL